MNWQDVVKEIHGGFNAWSAHTDLTFTAMDHGPVDIEIRFKTGIDGPGKILAYAYSPSGGGDVYFDDAEYWTTGQGISN